MIFVVDLVLASVFLVGYAMALAFEKASKAGICCTTVVADEGYYTILRVFFFCAQSSIAMVNVCLAVTALMMTPPLPLTGFAHIIGMDFLSVAIQNSSFKLPRDRTAMDCRV